MSMMQQPMLISSILEHAIVSHPNAEIVTRTVEGPIHRYTYAEAAKRSKQLANALGDKLGVKQGDRIATLAWNTSRHYELYFGVSGMGAITHTINPRLFPEQIAYIVGHAEDRYLFVDLTFLPLIEALKDKLPSLEGVVVLTDREHMPESDLELLCYEELIADCSETYEWPELDENAGAALCYTSGTTGNPKGVMYTHRSTVLHAMAACQNDALGIDVDSAILPVVPMFHVNAWGTPYAATMMGAKMIFPGAGMDGASIYELVESEKATQLLGVPTIWLGLLNYLDEVGKKLDTVHTVVVGGAAAHMPESDLELLCYEELIADCSEAYEWPELDENAGAALCYTSGTTGNPKGVMYTHRSTVLHAMAACQNDALGIDVDSAILPVVPMFHVNAWGTPYAATMMGAKMIFPGAGMDGASIYELVESEKATQLLGVPTIWLGLLNYLDEVGKKLDTVHTVVVGGAAAPLSMVKAFQEKHDAFLLHAWGMTEMSPIGTVNSLTQKMREMPIEERYQHQLKQGRAVFGVEMKIIDDDGKALPHDGEAYGRLLVRGPWIVDEYYKNEDRSSFVDGWFDTGDVATIDPDNTMQIVDRAKDVIKSGGEWISSIELENQAVGHPDLSECCVIGVAHPKWDERPLLLAVRKEGTDPSPDSIREFLEDKVAKWWLPDAVVFVDELPHTATGKLLKLGLRKDYANYLTENGLA